MPGCIRTWPVPWRMRVSDPQLDDVLAEAVRGVAGTSRIGQQQMAHAISKSLDDGGHLLIQAGTGTGKSLGYLVPALSWTVLHDRTVVVATATLALQNQLVHKDIPVAARAVAAVVGRTPRTAILKGRSNHVCLLKARDQPGATQDSLLGGTDLLDATRAAGSDDASVLGAEVLTLREWAELQAGSAELGDRDDAPSHSARAWAQVSVSSRECIGASKCPYGAECFAEEARARARRADLVVTNHALLAIEAMTNSSILPEHDAVIIDEAHELVARVTNAATAELNPGLVERTTQRCLPWLDDDLGVDLLGLADELRGALAARDPGRVEAPEEALGGVLERLREASRRAVSQVSASLDKDQPDDPGRGLVAGVMKDLFETSERMAKLSELDVVWTTRSERLGDGLSVAPLSVAGLMNQAVLSQHTTILTSATLTLGGRFDAIAGSVGLCKNDRIALDDEVVDESSWRGLDVGSPFDYARQGILYVAAGLGNPRPEGISADALEQLAGLVWAAGGRTLGLFASQRSAEVAAEYLRTAFPTLEVMCQGQDHLAELTRHFVEDESSVLVGTMSLWQGVDVPGDTCQLVVIDKIPFPRPDDPLMQARQQAVARAGGNGFMQVAATQAALLLAQGAGRLIRRDTDRGVVAILDPRLVTARYGGFLLSSLPPFWTTTNHEVAIRALQRLRGGS